MTLILMVLTAFPLGWFVRDRRTSYMVFVALQCFLFAFQTGELVIEWVGGSSSAFGPYPKAHNSNVFSYLAVNVVIVTAGLGLVALGHRLRSKRLQGAERSTSPDSYASTTA